MKDEIESNKSYIVIGLATYKRPLMLANALSSLQKIRVPDDVIVKLILVDNDWSGSAKAIYQKYSKSFPFETEYYIENQRGIANARNALLSRALALNAHYLAFIDDDESVCENWLRALYSTIKSHGCQVVTGKVIYELPDNTEEWIRSGGYFSDKNYATGTVQLGAGTGNVLIDLDFVKKYSLEFEQVFNFSGGEDTYFFKSLIKFGGKIVWCQEAVAYETVPNSRLTESWILGRACKVGYTTLLRYGLDNSYYNTLLFFFKFIFSQAVLFGVGILPSIYQLFFKGNRSSWVTSKRKLHKMKGAYNFMREKQHEEYRYVQGY